MKLGVSRTTKRAVSEQATRFRIACERYRDEHFKPYGYMDRFPWSCCTLASEALMQFYRDEGRQGAELLNYRFGQGFFDAHDIVLVDGWTVDITRDQFPNVKRRVFVRRQSELPKRWELLGRYSIEELPGNREPTKFARLYEDIRRYLPVKS